MYYQVEQVLEKQEPEIEKFYKGRGILICESKQNLFALKEYSGSLQKAEFLYWLGICLEQQGIRCDAMLKNKEGALLTEGVDHVFYTFHRWMRGRECEVNNRVDLLLAVSFLAQFHRSCCGEEFVSVLEQKNVSEHKNMESAEADSNGGLCGEYRKHDRDLRHIRKYILKRNNKSDFERLFLQCFDQFYQQSETVVDFLEKDPEKDGGYTVGICHGEVNQHNILFTPDGVALIHLEHSGVGLQISDLGNFMRKIMEKNNWNVRLGTELLEGYRRKHALTAQDLQGLYYRLAYPEKFWKIANQYYRTRKVWDSGKNYEKLQKEIWQNQARGEFLAMLKQEL